MQENWQQLIDNFDVSKSYVLAAIIETKGATYQKPGALMTVDDQGQCIGLLSGGCLEADISLHAKQVFDSGVSIKLTYDLTTNADLLWGLGLGCDGALIIQLQLITPENNHLEYGKLLASVAAGKHGFYWLSTKENDNSDCAPSNIFQAVADINSLSVAPQNIPSQLLAPENTSFQGLCIPVRAILSILICGAGPDAVPVIELCKQQGWQASIWDHRAPYLSQPFFDNVDNKRKIRPENISSSEEFSAFDGVILMTHNLTFDQQYLEQVIPSTVNYIGVLGPKSRLNKLLKNIEQPKLNTDGRIYGPVGLDLGGRGPQTIALSIAAQIQQHFYQVPITPTKQKRKTAYPFGYLRQLEVTE